MSMSLLRTSAFIRSARKFLKKNPEAQEGFMSALEMLEADPFHPSLRTHKLTGELAGSWACSAGYDLRILFSIVKHEGKQAILLETVGTHDEVY